MNKQIQAEMEKMQESFWTEEMSKTMQFHVRLEVPIKKIVDSVAQQKGMPVNKWVRMAIMEKLRRDYRGFG